MMDNVKDEFEVKATYDVDIIRIADYIKNIVATRSIPDGKKGVVVMKLDVEVTLLCYLVSDDIDVS